MFVFLIQCTSDDGMAQMAFPMQYWTGCKGQDVVYAVVDRSCQDSVRSSSPCHVHFSSPALAESLSRSSVACINGVFQGNYTFFGLP